jgi:hypothetical protein
VGYFFLFFGGAAHFFLRQILSFFGENIWELFFSTEDSTNFPIFWDNFAKFSMSHINWEKENPLVLGNFILLFLGEKFAKFSMPQNCKKIKTLVVGTFLGAF